ncbi:MAG: rod shape-determining protein [Myxococcota bacterium]
MFSRDLAIDLGCSAARIYTRGEGLVVSKPNIIAVRRNGRDSREIFAIGSAASRMIGRTPPDISIVHPVKGGAIFDFECMDAVLRCLAPKKGLFDGLRRPRFVVAVPFDLSEVERRAVYEIAAQAGGRDIRLIPKIMAAAIGLGLPIKRPSGHLVLDIGGGTTEIGVLSLSGVVTASSLRVGGMSMNDALRSYVKRKCNLLIGDQTAERLKIQIGTAYPTDDVFSLEIRGRDLISGVPKTVEINSEEAREALEEPVSAIVASLRDTLERTPPELSADIFERGIVMVGGGSLLANLDFRLREAVGLPVIRAENPMNAVVSGAGRVLEDPRAFEGLWL